LIPQGLKGLYILEKAHVEWRLLIACGVIRVAEELAAPEKSAGSLSDLAHCSPGGTISYLI
jgi:hypothetical protein